MNLRRFFFAVSMIVCLLRGGAVMADPLVRPIPPQAAFGEMGAISSNQAVIGNYAYRLAPGIQIRNTDNLIILSDVLRNFSGTVKVRYLVDTNGDLYRVWILTADEIATLGSSNLPAQPLPQPSTPMLGTPGQAATSPSY